MSPTSGQPTVLHVAPHADDELIGAPGALMALRDAGWRVVNLTCSLGPEADRQRRRAEVTEACRRAGFEAEVLEEPLPDPVEPGGVRALRHQVAEEVASRLRRLRPGVVVAPSPHDRHRGHEVVGRAVLDAWAALGDAAPRRLWLWGLWADLPFASLLVALDGERLGEILEALSAHAGELARNDYRRLVRGRAEMNAALGPERVFGFGVRAAGTDFVEVLCEMGHHHGAWRLGRPRWLEAGSPFGDLGDVVLDDWLTEPSVSDRFGPPGEAPL